jgi:hypothetical protein
VATFSAFNGGCVSLISSGTGERDAQFVDANVGAGDVFLATGTSLVAQDPDLIDIYDARIGGGFPPPPPPRPSCEGESCAGPAGTPPNDPTPPSIDFAGPGNVKPKPRCPKGKHRAKKKGKVHCVRNHRKQGKQVAHRQRGSRR